MQQPIENIVDLSGISLDRALKEWRTLLGDEHVLTGEAARAYNNCPSQTVAHIPAVLQPASQEQVQQIVAIAATHKVSLHPVSTGRNWGFGGATPALNSCVIVDLHRMNRILDFVADLGIITIEPGVTQRQLADFLQQGNYPFMIAASSSSPNCSVIGNALERGHSLMPYTDRFLSLTALKAILPDGSMYQSLLADGGGELIDKAYKWGVGPYLDGLFSQGGFGVVTQASFLLAPRPEQTTMFFFRPLPNINLDALLAQLRKVRHNAGNLISTFEIGTRPVANAEEKDALAGWTIMGGIHASKAMTKLVLKIMQRDLRKFAQDFVFIHQDNIDRHMKPAFWQRNTPMRSYVRQNEEMIRGMLGFFEGTPQDKAMSYAYNHRLSVLNGDDSLESLERNMRNTGLIWYWPLLPARGSDVRLFIDMINRVSKQHGFEPVWNFNLGHATYLSAGIHIFYNPETEQNKAQAYYEALFREGKALGYLPHRAHIDSGPLYHEGSDSHYFALLKKLKQGVDPKGIISMRVPLPKNLNEKDR